MENGYLWPSDMVAVTKESGTKRLSTVDLCTITSTQYIVSFPASHTPGFHHLLSQVCESGQFTVILCWTGVDSLIPSSHSHRCESGNETTVHSCHALNRSRQSHSQPTFSRSKNGTTAEVWLGHVHCALKNTPKAKYYPQKLLYGQDYDQLSIYNYVLKATCRPKTGLHNFFTQLCSQWKLNELHLHSFNNYGWKFPWKGINLVGWCPVHTSVGMNHIMALPALTQISLLVEQPIQVYWEIPSWLKEHSNTTHRSWPRLWSTESFNSTKGNLQAKNTFSHW